MRWIDTEKWNEIFISISKHKLRTALTAIGVFWGIFMLVILLGVGRGLQNGVANQFRGDLVNILRIYSGTTSKEFQGLPVERRIYFDNADYERLKTDFPEITYLAGRIFLSGDQNVRFEDKNLSFNVRAVHPDMRYIENYRMVSGRFVSEKDLEDLRKVAVIGKIVAEDVFGDREPVGKEILLGSINYRVVGVFNIPESNQSNREILIPITVGQTVYQGNERISNMSVVTSDMSGKELSVLEQKIRETLAVNHQFDPDDQRAMYINNRYEDYKQVKNLFLGVDLFLWFVGLGSILAGIVGVSNIMMIIVKDRTKEIGIRKALGATPRSIVSMVLSEAIFITSMAGYIGLFCGVLVLYIIGGAETEFFMNPRINLGIGITAIVILVVAGGLAGLIPARQAAKVNPIVAMRS